MRSLIEGPPEQPQEVIARQAGFAGDLLQIQWQMVALIDECPRANESLIRLDSNRRIRLYLAFVLHLKDLISFASCDSLALFAKWPSQLSALHLPRTGRPSS